MGSFLTPPTRGGSRATPTCFANCRLTGRIRFASVTVRPGNALVVAARPWQSLERHPNIGREYSQSSRGFCSGLSLTPGIY